MIIIGEKINGSIPVVADAIARRDAEFIKERARMQDAEDKALQRLACIGQTSDGAK